MDVKLSVTTKCNANCATCPVWSFKGQDMTVKNFTKIWGKLMLSSNVNRILINNTGDMYNHPDRREIFSIIEDNHTKPVIMTTNAGKMDYVPAVDLLIISFNGGNMKSYERTTGMDFVKTVSNIRAHYEDFKKVGSLEMHCLIWEGNKGCEAALMKLWADFPGKLRVSYKYDNQMKEDKTLPEYRRKDRVYCDYLDMLSVWPNGQIISCAHDFAGVTNWGNILDQSVRTLLENPARCEKQIEHEKGVFTGLCEKCNYNTPTDGKIEYLKD